MVKNYLKVMIRNMLKHKLYLIINVLGLSVAVTCIVLAVAFVLDERSFDGFHSKKDRIYRVVKRNVNPNTGSERMTMEVSGFMGPTLLKDYPEVENYVRFVPWFDPVVVTYKKRSFKVDDFVFTDSTLFDVFDFELLRGDKNDVLKAPGSIVLTESLANKLFQDVDPVGKEVIGLNDVILNITGIVKDPPRNSHIQFDALISWTSTQEESGYFSFSFMNNWLTQIAYTYILLNENVNPANLDEKFTDFMERYFPERAEWYFPFLQPFNQVYLHSDDFYGNRNFLMGSITFIRILLIITGFILLIACVNYININTSKATKRAAEVGVRKVMGAEKKQLVVQFLYESFMIVLLSTLLGLFLADLLLPSFNSLTGKNIPFEILFSGSVLLSMLIILVTVSVIAGTYPAFVLSSFKPASVLKSTKGNSSFGAGARKFLIVFQFLISITLIGGTIFVIQQTKFLKTKDLGFDKDHVIVLELSNSLGENHESFKNELMAHSNIESVSICQAAIGTGTFGTTCYPEGLNEEMGLQMFRIDQDFIKTYGLEMKEGRWFEHSDDPSLFKLIVNETFVEKAGWDYPRQSQVRFSPDSEPREVIGVVKDFNYLPLNEWKLDPVVMYVLPDNYNNASVKISGDNFSETISYMKSVWEKYESREPFDYYFVDQWFDDQYKSQQQLLTTVTIFSFISILIACLGLYGLTSFTIEQKTKEIGIRKAFGASLSNITMMINKQFIVLVFIAFLLASPVCYYFINQWLQDFPYRIDISYWVFFIAGFIALLIALFSVSFQAINAAKINPAETLSYE